MNPLNFPEFDCKIKEENGKWYIFDGIRKKYLVLTPEEWVRQHIVNFLIHHRQYPKSLIRLEGGTQFNEVRGRSDIVVFGRDGNPFLLVECKAPEIKLSQRDIEQLGIYNLNHRAAYIMLSNGLQNHVYHIDHASKKASWLENIPEFPLVDFL